jgi:hypothetical protein
MQTMHINNMHVINMKCCSQTRIENFSERGGGATLNSEGVGYCKYSKCDPH